MPVSIVGTQEAGLKLLIKQRQQIHNQAASWNDLITNIWFLSKQFLDSFIIFSNFNGDTDFHI